MHIAIHHHARDSVYFQC